MIASLWAAHGQAFAGPDVNAFLRATVPAARALSPQTITFPALGAKTYGSPPFAILATASSGLIVSFASLSTGVCTVSGVTVSLVAAGTCTIRASQAGNATYAAAPNVDQSFVATAAAAAIAFAPAVNYATGSYPEAIALGDFNGDGVPDLAVANAFSSNVSILIGHSDGTFTAGTSVLAGGIPIALAVGDFNGDGKLDLAICDFASGTVVIFTGNGNGTFNRLAVFNAGLYPDSIAVGDFDRDGKLDLIVANGTSGSTTGQTVSVLMGNGNGSFRAPVSYAAGPSPYAVAVGDFNGDGRLDLAVATAGNDSVSILKGNGDGTFAVAASYATGDFPDGLAIGDFNGDGKLDLAVVNDYSNNVSVLLGRGDGTFGPAANFTTGSGSASIAVADFNGDGRPDLAIVNRFDNNLAVLLGNGDGTFQPRVTYGVGGAPSAVVARDLNGDGKPDVVVSSATNNNVSVMLQTGAVPVSLSVQSGSSQSAVVGTAYATPLAVLVHDAGGHPLAGVSIMFTAPASGPSGAFSGAGAVAQAGSNASGVATAPAFTANATPGPFSVVASVAALNASFSLTNTAAPSGAAPVFTSSPPPNGTVGTPYNFNVTASSTPAPTFFVLPNSLPTGLSLNGNSGLIAGTPSTRATFAGVLTAANGVLPNAAQPFAITIGGMPQSISFGALSGKTLGSPPFAVSATASSGLPVAFLAQTAAVCGVSGTQVSLIAVGTCTIRATQAGSTSYAAAPNVDQSFQVTAAPNQSPTIVLKTPNDNSAYVAPAVVPLYAIASDPDGSIARVEFYSGATLLGAATSPPYTYRWAAVAAGSYSVTAKAYDNQGATKSSAVANIIVSVSGQHPTFVHTADFSVGNTPLNLVVGEFNSDGKLDLVVPLVSGGAVTMMRGDGLGNFVISGQSSSGGASGGFSGALSADFNGDGKLDLATSNSGFVAVQLGDGAGGLSAGVHYPISAGAFAIASGDVNGDGKLDLITANGDGNASILLGKGDGTFQPAVNVPAGTLLEGVAAGDLNGDGKLDLVVTNPGDQSIAILLGNGDGSFRAATHIVIGVFPSSPNKVALGDFNGDGKLDIAISNLFNPNVSILLGNGDGSFQPAFDYPAGVGSHGIVAADFDGDGRIDLAVANTDDNSVAVLRGNGNGSFQAPVTIATGTGPAHIAVGDFNGDGRPDIAVDNLGSSTISVLVNTTGVTTHAPVFTNGRPPDGEAGVRYDFNFTATGIPSPIFSLSDPSFFATLQPDGLLTSGTPGSSGCPCPGLYSGVAMARNGVAPDATQAFSVLIRRANQTIAFDALSDRSIGSASFLDAMASSHLPVSFVSLTPDVCRVASDSPPTVTLTAVRAGSCTVRAEQTGNGYYAPAPSVDRSFTVLSSDLSYFGVAIASPADGADFAAPGTIALSAIAHNGYIESHVSQVSYYHDGGASIGTATTPPYGVGWTGVPLGTHVLTARATLINDLSGLVAGYADSAPVTVAVTAATDKPVVALTSPLPNSQYVAPASIALAAIAADTSSIARVEFYNGSALLGTATVAPYTFAWSDVPMGTFTLTARAINSTGAATTSAPIVISIDSGIPTALAWYNFDDAWTTSGYVHDVLGGFEGIPQGSVSTISATASAPKPDTCQAASFAGGAIDIRDLSVATPAGAKTTAAFWMRWDGSDGAMPLAWSTQGLMFSAGSFGFTTTNNDVYGIAATLLANAWHHVVAEFTNGGVVGDRLYVDGILQTLTQRSGTPTNANAVVSRNLRIGGRSNASDYRFTGQLDELQLFQGMLSAAHVNELYTATNPCAALKLTLVSPPKSVEYTAPATIELLAAASSQQTITRVDFYNGSTLLGSAFAQPYAFDWTNVGPGSFTLLAKAVAASGATVTSPGVAVTVIARAPDVALTAPIGGTTFSKTDTIHISASASETGGSIARVEFMADGSVVGTKASPPYEFAWVPPAAAFDTGYDLTARAIDARGASTTTLATRVYVITDQIGVSLTSPANNATFASPTAVILSANATPTQPGDTVAKVDFYSQLGSVTQLVGTATTSPYSVTWANFGAGTYNLSALATGTLGTAGHSQIVRVNIVGDSAPTLTLTSPVDGAQYIAPANISFAATATDPDGTIAKVDFFAGSTLIGTRAAPPYSATWSGAGPGSYAVTAKATDNLGVTTLSKSVNVVVSGSVTPSITLTSPPNGTQYAQGQPVVLTANAATPNRIIARVEFYADSALLSTVIVPGTVAAAIATSTWNGASVGTHVVSAKVIATDGTSVTSAPVNITVADLKIMLAAPFAGQVYQSPGDVRITASPTETSGTIVRVDFYGDGGLLGSALAAPYSYLWSSVPVGTHTVYAMARNNGGLTATAAPVTISVISAPSVTVDGGIDGSTVADDNVSISGTAQAPINSAVSVNGQLAAMERNGRFYVDGVSLQPGSNTVTLAINTQDGPIVTKTILINRSGQAPFAVSVMPTQGLAPLAVQIAVTNRGNIPFQRIEIDGNGDGTPELTLTSLPDAGALISLNYINGGVYNLRVTVFNASNQAIYTAKRTIVARDPRDLASVVAQVFTGMLDRLHAGNIAGAMGAITNTVRNKYQSVFTRLGASLPSVVDHFGVQSTISVTEEFADITLVRTKPDGNYGYHVLLILDDDGLWRIDGM